MADNDTEDWVSAYKERKRYRILNDELVSPEYKRFLEENSLLPLNDAAPGVWWELHEKGQNIFNKVKSRFHYFKGKIVSFQFTSSFRFTFEERSIQEFLKEVEKLGDELEVTKKREKIYSFGFYGVLFAVFLVTWIIIPFFIFSDAKIYLHIPLFVGATVFLVLLERFIKRYHVNKKNWDIRRALNKLKTEIEGIAKPSRKETRSVGENKTFVNLIRVAQEDPKIRAKLLKILSLDKFHRESLLNTSLEEMRLKGAPKEFVSAISTLLDDAVAQRALEILGGSKSNRPE